MTNYRRLISYIYAYEGEVKGKNIGFAKLESRNGQCKLSVNVKKVYVGSSDLGVYLLAPGKEIFLGSIFIRSGSGEFRAAVSVENAADSGCNMDQCYGLTIHEQGESWRAYTTIWEDAVAHAAEVDLADVTSRHVGNAEAQIHRKVEELNQELKAEETARVKETGPVLSSSPAAAREIGGGSQAIAEGAAADQHRAAADDQTADNGQAVAKGRQANQDESAAEYRVAENGGIGPEGQQVGDGEDVSEYQQAGDGESISENQQVGDGEDVSEYQQVGDGEAVSENQQVGDGEDVSEYQQVGDGEDVSEYQQVGDGEDVSEYQQVGDGEDVSEYQQVGNGEDVSEYQQVGDGEPASEYQQAGDGEPVSEYQQAGDGEPVSEYQQVGDGEPVSEYQQVGDGETTIEYQQTDHDETGAEYEMSEHGQSAVHEKRADADHVDYLSRAKTGMGQNDSAVTKSEAVHKDSLSLKPQELEGTGSSEVSEGTDCWEIQTGEDMPQNITQDTTADREGTVNEQRLPFDTETETGNIPVKEYRYSKEQTPEQGLGSWETEPAGRYQYNQNPQPMWRGSNMSGMRGLRPSDNVRGARTPLERGSMMWGKNCMPSQNPTDNWSSGQPDNMENRDLQQIETAPDSWIPLQPDNLPETRTVPRPNAMTRPGMPHRQTPMGVRRANPSAVSEYHDAQPHHEPVAATPAGTGSRQPSSQPGMSAGYTSGQTGMRTQQPLGHGGIHTQQPTGQTAMPPQQPSGQAGMRTQQPSNQAGMQTQQPSGQAGMRFQQPSGQAGMRTQQPSNQAGMRTQQPLGQAGMQTQQPSNQAGMQTQQPLGQAGMRTQQPLGQAGMQTQQPSGHMGMRSQQSSSQAGMWPRKFPAPAAMGAETPAALSEAQTDQPAASSATQTDQPAASSAAQTSQPAASSAAQTSQPATSAAAQVQQPETDTQEDVNQTGERIPVIDSGEETFVLGDPQELERLEQEEQQNYLPQQMWDGFRKRYPKVQAFDSASGCEILTIKPQDIGLLPRENWNFGNNSFLLHGYYNYRYLILARIGDSSKGRTRFILGVPGNYYSNEKYMASMFGFPHFVLAKKQPSQDGRFGYWYTDIRLENQD